MLGPPSQYKHSRFNRNRNVRTISIHSAVLAFLIETVIVTTKLIGYYLPFYIQAVMVILPNEALAGGIGGALGFAGFVRKR